MLHPLLFQPVFMERVWGGRNLERLYQKPLPAGKVIGESWEISDRPEAVSVVANGPLAGKTLRWLLRAGNQKKSRQPASHIGLVRMTRTSIAG